MSSPSIYSYIKSQENAYETEEVQVGDNWFWGMRKHIQLIFHLKHSIFFTGENDWLRPFKNIMQPLLNLAYWTEDIEVKDVVFYIEGDEGRVLSFLVKKYHDEVFVKEHDLDTFFDDVTESDIDFGGALVQKTDTPRPELLPLVTIAFCDQTNLLGGAVGFKHHFSPDALRKMKKVGWGEEKNGATISIDDLVILADTAKDPYGVDSNKTNKTPSKNIEVYVVRGPLPEHYLEDNDNMEDWYGQLQVVAFYTNKKGKKEGVTLYRKADNGENLLFHTSKTVPNRALGLGEGEMLLHPQVWTNWTNLHKNNLLEAGAKVPLYTDDPNFTNRNQVQDMENLEVMKISSESKIGQIPTAAPANIQILANAVNDWFEHAQLQGAAYDPMLGKEAVSGTTFRGQERTVAQGRGLHDRRRGQRAKFLERVYREWIIPDMAAEITNGAKFLATLSPEELMWVSEQLIEQAINDKVKDRLLNSDGIFTREEADELRTVMRENFSKGSNKQMIEILKGEFRDVEIRMGINIANKQKDLAAMSDKILSIFQFVFANPTGFQQAMQIPALAKGFNDILEYSGINQADFNSLMTPPKQLPEETSVTPQRSQPAPMANVVLPA